MPDYTFNYGGQLVENPNYTPENGQPKYIYASSIANGNSPLAIAYTNASRSGQLGLLGETKDLQKYVDYGITPNDWENNLDAQLADAQSNWEKARNALFQTVVSEIGLGTVRGISDLFDFATGAAFKTDNDYSNPVSAKLQEWQDKFNEEFPIYQTPGVNISNGGLTDAGWWFSNMPSIASSLTLLIPSTGAVKAASWLGKATKAFRGLGKARRFLTQIDKVDDAIRAGKKLNELNEFERLRLAANNPLFVERANQAVELGSNALISRVMENYQEAQQTYSDLLPVLYNGDNTTKGILEMSDEEYQNMVTRNADILSDVDTNDKYAVAKKLAKSAADKTFQIDMGNVVFDAIELYGLRNITRFANAPMRESIRKAQRTSLKYLTKSDKEIEDLVDKTKFTQKAKDFIGDKLYVSGITTAGELSEGAEEAINYIAQEEGLTYGHMLLDDTYTDIPWDTRLKNYASNPEMYDAAFWGVLGGVVFQGAGSALAGAYRGIQTKINEKQYKEDNKTGEQVKKSSWREAIESPEIKGRLDDINSRKTKFTSFVSKLKDIDSKKNPYATGDNDAILNNEEEKAVARERAENDLITNMLMNSMFVGNYNLTREFLESNEFKQAVIESGYVTEADANELQAKARRIGDTLLDSYGRQLRAVGNALQGRDPSTGAYYSDIPMDYYQLVAAENIIHEINANQFARNIERYQPIIGSEEERLKDELTTNGINYKESIRAYVLARALGEINAELDAARKTIKEGRTENNIDPRSIAGQSAIRELELRKKVLTRMIDDIQGKALGGLSKGFATHLVVNRAIAAVISNGEGGYKVDLNNKKYKDLDDAIVKAFNSDESNWTENRKRLSELMDTDTFSFKNATLEQFKEAATQADVFNENIAAALGAKGSINKLSDYSKQLLDAYIEVTTNEINRNIELSHIATDRDSVRQAAHIKHNEQNAFRSSFIEMANNSLKKLARGLVEEGYDANEVSNMLAYGTIDRNYRSRLNNILTPTDFNVYDDAMRILALTKPVNSVLPELIKDSLYYSSLDNFEDVIEDEQENSSANQNPSESNQNQATKKPTQTTSKTTDKPKSQGKIDFTINSAGKKMTIPAAVIHVNDDGKPIKLTPVNRDENNYASTQLIPIAGYDNTYELDFRSDVANGTPNQEPLNNPYLFDVVNPIIDGGVIKENPRVVVDDEGNVKDFRPGKIEKPKEGDEDQSLSSTGGLQESESPTITPAEDDTQEFDAAGTESEEYTEGDLRRDTQVGIIGEIRNALQEGRDYDEEVIINNVRTSLRESLQDKVPFDEIDKMIEENKDFGRNWAKKAKLNIKEAKDLGDIADTKFSSISDASLGLDKNAELKKELQEAFDRVFQNYLDRTVHYRKGDKHYITLASLLRYANEVAEDSRMAEYLYDRFRIAIKNRKDIVVIEDLNRHTSDSIIITRANSPIQDYTPQNKNVNGRSIQLIAGENEVNEVLDKLEPGKEIDFEVNDGKIDFKVGGVKIATATIPTETDNSYRMVRKGWIYDTPKTNDGTQSRLEVLFKNLIANTNNRDSCREVMRLLQEAMYTPKTRKNLEVKGGIETNPDYTEILGKILKQVEIVLKENGETLDSYISLGSSYKETDLVEHLITVARNVQSDINNFIASSKENKKEEYKNRIERSVANWFAKIKDSDTSVMTLAKNPNYKIEVDTIFEGGLITTNERNPIDGEGIIGSNHKGQLEVGVVEHQGTIETTDRKNIDLSNITEGSTFIVIPRKQGNPDLIHAYGRTIGDESKHKAIKEINQEVIAQLEKLFNEWANNRNLSTADIYNFINNLTKTSNDNKPLFIGLRVDPLTNTYAGKGVQISYKVDGVRHYIKLFDVSNYGNRVSVIKFDREPAINVVTNKDGKTKALNDLKRIFKDSLKYNIQYDFVKGYRGNSTYARINNKGEFIVEIPGGKVHKFKSYKDFIINNGVVDVTTKSKDGKTNFQRTPVEDSKEYVAFEDRPNVTFRILTNSKPPVGKRKTEIISKEPVEPNVRVGDEIKEIIDARGTTEDVGQEIIDKLLDDSKLNILKNSKILQQLSFKNIIFVKSIPDAIASYNITRDIISVSQKWIDMANSDDVKDREEAFRHLVHEALHRKIRELPTKKRKQFYAEIRSVFNAFVEANKRDKVDAGILEFEYHKKKYRKEDGEINSAGLEEFIVESLTRPALIKRLNQIADEGKRITNRQIGNKKSKNLFQRVLKLIADMFGLNINKGSLLEREYNLYNEFMIDSNKETNINVEQQKQTETSNEQVETETEQVETTESEEEDDDEEDEYINSSIDDGTIASLSQIRENIDSDNVKDFQRLLNKGGIIIKC